MYDSVPDLFDFVAEGNNQDCCADVAGKANGHDDCLQVKTFSSFLQSLLQQALAARSRLPWTGWL